MRKITWYGHAAFKVEMDNLRVLFDPWIEGNPVTPLESYKDVGSVDLVLVSHDHADHGFSDALKICQKTGAAFVGVIDLAEKAQTQGVDDVVEGNIGGEVVISSGVKVFFTQAIHTSDVGVPCGFVLSSPHLTVYHAGDTGYFSDMALLGKLYEIDIALLPIGGGFTMGPEHAAMAANIIRPKLAIPCHYNTFPFLQQDPERFTSRVDKGIETAILEIGKPLELEQLR